MEEKILNLVEKMYVEFNKKFENIDSRFDTMEKEIRNVSNRITIMENDLKPKVETALEGYKVVYEKLQEHDNRFTALENKVDNLSLSITKHEARFELLEGVKNGR